MYTLSPLSFYKLQYSCFFVCCECRTKSSTAILNPCIKTTLHTNDSTQSIFCKLALVRMVYNIYCHCPLLSRNTTDTWQKPGGDRRRKLRHFRVFASRHFVDGPRLWRHRVPPVDAQRELSGFLRSASMKVNNSRIRKLLLNAYLKVEKSW